MCDGARYIRSVALKVFPEAIVQLCSFHFWQTQEAKLKDKSLVPKLANNDQTPARFQKEIDDVNFKGERK